LVEEAGNLLELRELLALRDLMQEVTPALGGET
jgi:hypothetical protein